MQPEMVGCLSTAQMHRRLTEGDVVVIGVILVILLRDVGGWDVGGLLMRRGHFK